MINKAILRGRLCHDIVLKRTDNGTSLCEYTVAVNRGYGENRETDFIDCEAWGKTAEFIAAYFSKGKMIEVEGRLKGRLWNDRNGNKRYSLKVRTESVDFGESKKNESSKAGAGNSISSSGIEAADDMEDDLPQR